MAQNNAAAAVQNLFRTPELKDKILFTLLCLLIYRIGAAVTAPGINPQAIADFMNQQSNGGGEADGQRHYAERKQGQRGRQDGERQHEHGEADQQQDHGASRPHCMRTRR